MNRQHPGLTGVLLFLCLGIAIQMLGVPATLLDPAITADLHASTVLEGFSMVSVLPTIPTLRQEGAAASIGETLLLSLFVVDLLRPPLR